MKRLLYPDLLRTFAIALMIAFHAAYDLALYYGYDIAVFEGGWLVLGRTAALLFLVLAGVSAALSHDAGFSWFRTRSRIVKIAAGAVIVSAVTFVIDPGTFVRFGILHLIAFTSLYLAVTRRFGFWQAPIGIVIVILGFLRPEFLAPLAQAPDWIRIPLGFPPSTFVSVDYYPFLPWAGAMIAGYGFALPLVPLLRTSPAVVESPFPLRALSVPGRWSLLVYLVHQPVLLLIFWILFGRLAG